MTTGRILALVLILHLSSAVGFAQARWCSISGRASGDTLFYPPIARVARVEGVVLTRVTYTPAGFVLKAETISGPPLLAASVEEQIKK